MKSYLSCTKKLESVPRSTGFIFTGFCGVSELLGFFFLIAEDFFMFLGPEYEHLNFILKAFLWAEGHFVACPSSSRNNLKTSNYGGLLSLCGFVLLNLCTLRKLF